MEVVTWKIKSSFTVELSPRGKVRVRSIRGNYLEKYLGVRGFYIKIANANKYLSDIVANKYLGKRPSSSHRVIRLNGVSDDNRPINLAYHLDSPLEDIKDIEWKEKIRKKWSSIGSFNLT